MPQTQELKCAAKQTPEKHSFQKLCSVCCFSSARCRASCASLLPCDQFTMHRVRWSACMAPCASGDTSMNI